MIGDVDVYVYMYIKYMYTWREGERGEYELWKNIDMTRLCEDT